MAGRTIAEAATERETLTRDPLMWHGTIVTQDRLCSEMLATFRMSRAKSGLSTNGPTPVIPAALIFVSTGFIPLGVGISNLLMTWRPVPPGRHRDYRLEDNNQTVAIALTSYRLQSANGMARDRFSNNQKL
tara:strand:+ start:706 stop:1098 length:393 start_codon:yes stop_codon:yes gene_type:complete